MQIFACEVHVFTRAAALLFAIYLMWYSRANKTHPIFLGGVVMGGFDLYTWYHTDCVTTE